MAYTVKKLATLSGVSVRTLHFYDEIGLLTPAYVGDQGYRYYEEEELLMLQQILFLRELGFELKEIQRILTQSEFDKMKALEGHRKTLQEKQIHMKELIQTVDKTIERIKGNKKMNDKEMFQGFSPEKQTEYENYIVNRYGDKAKTWVADSKENTKDWTKSKWDTSFGEWDIICKELSLLMDKQISVESKEVQAVVKRHFDLIKQFWMPNQASYIGLGQSYTEYEWKSGFEKHDSSHPKLARYLADAIKVFAMRELD